MGSKRAPAALLPEGTTVTLLIGEGVRPPEPRAERDRGYPARLRRTWPPGGGPRPSMESTTVADLSSHYLYLRRTPHCQTSPICGFVPVQPGYQWRRCCQIPVQGQR